MKYKIQVGFTGNELLVPKEGLGEFNNPLITLNFNKNQIENSFENGVTYVDLDFDEAPNDSFHRKEIIS